MTLSDGVRADVSNVLKGAMMGGADVVPGVSGGTVALVVGIYERLVAAISHCDRQLLDCLRRREWQAAADHIDLRFLVALGAGVGLGVVAFGGTVNGLLTDAGWRPLTLAAFFGMILASAVLVAGMIGARSPRDMVQSAAFVAIGACFAYWVTSLDGSAVEPSLGYLFFCGFVAICAMILPGISGAYLLLVLGVYLYLTDILHRLPRLQIEANDALVVLVFGAGCALGLITFSKALRWLLRSQRPATMAVLCGFMLGAVRKVWPFQHDLTPHTESFKEKTFENVFPQAWDASVGACLLTVLVAFIAVFLIDLGFRDQNASPLSGGDDSSDPVK